MQVDGEVGPVTWDGRFWMVQSLTTIRLIIAISFPAAAVAAPVPFALVLYLMAIGTDLADGSLARRWGCATRGGDWFDAFADRMLTTMSGVYGVLAGVSTLACSWIIARDLAAVSMNELRSEGGNRLARFLGLVTVTPVRVVTIYVLGLRAVNLSAEDVSSVYWVCAGIGWLTFVFNAWLRRAIVAARFGEPDEEKLLR